MTTSTLADRKDRWEKATVDDEGIVFLDKKAPRPIHDPIIRGLVEEKIRKEKEDQEEHQRKIDRYFSVKEPPLPFQGKELEKILSACLDPVGLSHLINSYDIVASRLYRGDETYGPVLDPLY